MEYLKSLVERLVGYYSPNPQAQFPHNFNLISIIDSEQGTKAEFSVESSIIYLYPLTQELKSEFELELNFKKLSKILKESFPDIWLVVEETQKKVISFYICTKNQKYNEAVELRTQIKDEIIKISEMIIKNKDIKLLDTE